MRNLYKFHNLIKFMIINEQKPVQLNWKGLGSSNMFQQAIRTHSKDHILRLVFSMIKSWEGVGKLKWTLVHLIIRLHQMMIHIHPCWNLQWRWIWWQKIESTTTSRNLIWYLFCLPFNGVQNWVVTEECFWGCLVALFRMIFLQEEELGVSPIGEIWRSVSLLTTINKRFWSISHSSSSGWSIYLWRTAKVQDFGTWKVAPKQKNK